MRSSALARDVTEVGPGDYVKHMDRWCKIITNTAYDQKPLPREWTITAEGNLTLSMYQCQAYAFAQDVENLRTDEAEKLKFGLENRDPPPG